MTSTLTLVRILASAKGAFGVLLKDGEAVAVTVEHIYVSPSGPHAATAKIAAGFRYNCTRRMFFRGGYETFEVHVPGHQDILFHKANFAKDVDGCIGVASSFREFGTSFGTNPGISASAEGFATFMKLMTGVASFSLRVVDVTAQIEGV